jgi:uncharacterized protein DUF6894
MHGNKACSCGLISLQKPVLPAMQIFYFQIVDGQKLEDPTGLELKSRREAEQAAENIAKQIAIDLGPTSARKVVVITEDGDKVYTAPVKPQG